MAFGGQWHRAGARPPGGGPERGSIRVEYQTVEYADRGGNKWVLETTYTDFNPSQSWNPLPCLEPCSPTGTRMSQRRRMVFLINFKQN